jgi:hypothetical protein
LHGRTTWSFTFWEERRLRDFENKVARKIFGPKSDGVTGEWRGLHNEEIIDLYSSPDITIQVIKSKGMSLAGNVTLVEDRRGAIRISLVELRERDDLKDIGVDGRIILKLILKIKDGASTALILLRVGTSGGLL